MYDQTKYCNNLLIYTYIDGLFQENLDLYTIDLSHNDITDSGMKVFGISLGEKIYLCKKNTLKVML